MASPILDQYRQQVPAARQLDDEALAEEIRSRFYPEANPEQFKANLGVNRDLSRKIDQYRAREPKAWGLNDQELVTELHSRFGNNRSIEEFAQELGVAVGPTVGAEPSATGPGPATGDGVMRQPIQRDRSAEQEIEALGDTGYRFDAGRSGGFEGAPTFAGVREGGITDVPLRVDQNVNEAALSAYEMQGRGERSMDDLRRGVNRAQSAVNAFQLVNSVSRLADAERRMREREPLAVDARMRLAGEGSDNPAYSPEAIERRLLSADQRDSEIIEQERERSQEIAQRLAELQQTRSELGENIPLQRALEDGDVDSFLDQLGNNFFDVMSGLVLESLPAMAPALATGAVGGVAGGPVGFAVGTGAGSATIEGLMSIQEKLLEEGADLTDPESVNQVWQEKGPEILQDAGTRAALIGAFDALSGGLAATRVVPRGGAGTSFANRAGRNVAEGSIQLTGQAAAGSAGEASAQFAETGRIESPAAVLAEGVAEFGFAPVEVAGATISGARRQLRGPQDANDLRQRMVQEGYVENDDGTLQRGDIVVEIDENEARARMATPSPTFEPRPGTQDDEPERPTFEQIDSEIEQLRTDVIAPANDPDAPSPSPEQIDAAQQRIDELIQQREALTREMQTERPDQAPSDRLTGIADEFSADDQARATNQQVGAALSEIDAQANAAVDQGRVATDDALGERIDGLRAEARENINEITQQPETQAEPSPGNQPVLRSNGEPFATERSVRASARFRSATNPQIVSVDGGFGFVEQPETSSVENEETGILERRVRQLDQAARDAAPAVRDTLIAERDRLQSVIDGRTPRQSPQERMRRQLIVRPAEDDFVTAIQKLGGIDTQIETDFDGRLQSFRNRTPGLPGLERPGRGRSLDDLAESLEELGYLQDRSVEEMYERLDRVERGIPVFSNMVELNQMDEQMRSEPLPSRDFVDAEARRIDDAREDVEEVLSAAQEYFDSADEAGNRFAEEFYLSGSNDTRGNRDDQRALGEAINVAFEINEDLTDAIVAEAERIGEPFNVTTQRLENEVIRATDNGEGLSGSRPQAQGRGQGQPVPEPVPQDEALLTQPTPEELQARDQAAADRQAAEQEAQRRADADAQRDDFTLTGSDAEADQAAARGQDTLFSVSGDRIPQTEDAYIEAINPGNVRIQDADRPNLSMGDMYGMLPSDARVVGSADGVTYYQDGNNFYATALNPDLGEQDVVGYITGAQNDTELAVVEQMRGRGIGGNLSYLYRSRNPMAPSGGLTAAGESAARRAYRRITGQSSVAGIDPEQAARSASALMGDWRIAPRVNVARTESELPRAVRDIIAANGKAGQVRGVFYDGEVFVVAENLQSIAEMEEVILHEVLGHFGIRNVLGRNFNKVLDDAYLTIGRSGLESIAQRYNLDLNKKDQRREAVEEYLAQMAEANPDAKIIDRVVRLIAEWARSMGFQLNMTNAELRELMIRAKRFTQDGEIVTGVSVSQRIGGGVAMRTSSQGQGEPRFSISRAVGKAKERGEQLRYTSEEEFFGQVWPKFLRTTGLRRAPTQRNLRRGARQAIADMQNWLRENPQFMDYYSADMEATREVVESVFGEISNEQFQLFQAFLGLNSPNTGLRSNINDAFNAFDLYLRNGDLDAIEMAVSDKGNPVIGTAPFQLSGTTAPNKARTMKVVERLINEQGGIQQAIAYLQEEIPVKELHAFNRQMGYKGQVGDIGSIKSLVQEATGQSENIPRMFIFGRKVGAYTLNTLGDSRYTTIDIWESRFIRSYFAGMFEQGTGLPVSADEHEFFSQFNRVFKQEIEAEFGQEFEASALQAMRWFYILNAAREAGYGSARTESTISEYAREIAEQRFGSTDNESRQVRDGENAQESLTDTRFSFAGARSEQADLGSLEAAQSLEENGTSRTNILQRTGWFKGPDGMWRYEISDDQAQLNDSEIVSAEQVLAEIGDQFVITDTDDSGLIRAAFGEGSDYIAAFGRDEQSARESLARQIAKRRTAPNAFDPSRTEQLAGQFYRLDQLLDHPKLFAAYPSLSNVMVHIRDLDGARGRYRDNEQMIDIAPLERDQFFSTLLHEVQHAIQAKEGFARGGSSDFDFWKAVVEGVKELDVDARNRALGWQFENQEAIDRAEQASFNATMGLVYQSAQRLRDYASRSRPSSVYRLIRKESQWLYEPTFDRLERARELQREFFNIPNRGARRNEAISDLAYRVAETLESQIPEPLLEEFRSDKRKTESMVRALQRESQRARAGLQELSDLQQEAQRARNIRQSERLWSPYETYQALAGEIEARNTQARLNMDEDERRRVTPEMTQDVPRDEAIVIFGGLEMQVPQASIDKQPETAATRFSRRGVREANSSKEKTAAANRNGFPVKFRNDAAKETTAYVGRDRQGNWVTVKTSDPALREQNALKAWVKKKFTKEGQLTDRAYELHTQMLGQRNADEIDISGFTADFMRAVSRSYGRSYMRLDDSEKALLNEYLAGQDVQGIPDAVKAELDVMRGMLDNMSTRTQMMLLDEIKYALQDMSGEQSAQVAELIKLAQQGDQEAITAIREVSPHGNLIARKLRTFLAIEANKGGYLHRSYRAFDDPSWKDNVPEDVRRRAKAYLREQVRRDPTLQGLDESGVEDRVDGIINVILNSNASDMVDFMSQSQLGEKDLSVLKQRENIPEPIRELMGEYKDPRINFSRTMSHMSTLLASHHFLRSVREEGLGAFLSAQPSGRMSQEITSFNEERMLPLAGLYTTPEFRQALIDFAEGNNLEGWVKDLVRVTSSVKYGKTVLSPTTMFRNFYSASLFTVMNGHFGYTNMIKAAQTTWADIRGNTRARRDYMRRLAQLGVIHDSARAGEITAALDDIMDLDTTRGSAPVRVGKEALNIATRMYQAGDDFWKIVGYETEVNDLVKSGMAREEAEVLAAKRVRDGYPTYSMVPDAIQRLRRFPVAGTFVSFPWEIMRTAFNQIRMTQEDIQAGRKAKAARRLVGMSIAYSSALGIKTLTMAMFGIDDEEDEAVRKLAAPWQMNSQFAYLGHDEEGRMRYLDLSHLDPYNHLKRPITALMNGNYDDVGEAAVEGVKEFLAPYFGTDITAGVIGEVWANKKQGSGTPVYDEEADILTQGYQVAEHIFSSLRPGILLSVERTFKAFNNQMTSYGREYTLEDEALAWVGFRLTTSDPKVSMQFKSFDFSDRRSAAGRPTYRALRDPNIINPEEVGQGVENTYVRWREAFEEMHAVVRAGRVAGLSDQEIAESLDKGGVPQRDIAFIINERVPPWSPSSQSLENAINSVLEFNDSPEMRENLQQRFRAMRRAIIEQRQLLNQEQSSD